jgi:peptidoglycan/LPS O-acetylase OafA/YrhL
METIPAAKTPSRTPGTRPDGVVRVRELDGLRGALALWVVFSHILCWCGYAEHSKSHLWGDLVYAGPAVETFMILSGFAITSLLDARREPYVRFIAGRAFRLFPVYLVCLGVAVGFARLVPGIVAKLDWRDTPYFDGVRVVSADEMAHPFAHLAWHLGLLHGLPPRTLLLGSASAFLPPAWSISLEWQYYLVAPLVALAVWSPVGLLVAAAVSVAGAKFGAPWFNPAPAFLPLQLPLFLVGVASCRLRAAGVRPPVLAAVAVVGVALALSWHTFALALWTVGFGCTVLGPPGWKPAGLVSRLLLNRGLQHLGQISYPLYLLHWPLIVGFLCLLPHGASQVELLLLLSILGLPVILLAADLLHRLVEVPGIKTGRRFPGGHKSSRA